MSHIQKPTLKKSGESSSSAGEDSYIQQSYEEPPSLLEMAIALFTRSGISEAMGAVQARSVRIPMIENMSIEALAKYSGLSANKVIVQLLEVALDEVFQGFTDEQRVEVFRLRNLAFAAYDKDEHGFPIVTDTEMSKKGEI